MCIKRIYISFLSTTDDYVTRTNIVSRQFREIFFNTRSLFRIPEGAHPWYKKYIAAFSLIVPEYL